MAFRRGYGGRYGSVRGRRPVLRRRMIARGRGMVRRAPMRMYRAPAALYGGRGATEVKSVDLGTQQYYVGGFHTGPPAYVPLVNLAAAIPQNGAAFYNRIGTRTRGMSLEIRGSIQPTDSNAGAVIAGFIRVLVVYDRQPNGALPQYTDVMADYKNSGTTESGALSGLNMNNRDRFLVLRDRKLLVPGLQAAGGTIAGYSLAVGQGWSLTPGDDNNSLIYREFIKLKGLETHYKASTNPSAIGDVATGSYLLLLCHEYDYGDGVIAPAVHPTAWELSFDSRYKFLD